MAISGGLTVFPKEELSPLSFLVTFLVLNSLIWYLSSPIGTQHLLRAQWHGMNLSVI